MDLATYVPSAFMGLMKNASELITFAYDVPFARAVVFGVHIGGHLFVEGLLLVVIIFLLSQKSYKPPKRPLTTKEIDELCDEWVPESLIPPVIEEMKKEVPVLSSAAGPYTIINGKEVINFASANYLGLMSHEELLDSCTSSLEKYGVGSCGPRQFYGTIGVHWGIQNGLYLSRSTIVYFKHNDMQSLQSTLVKVTQDNKRAKKLRRYIVVEANSGQIAPLDEIIQLKEKYKFCVLLDESNSFGVLGKSGRGLTEHYDVPVDKIDIITAAMGHALASEGGFCTGSHRVVDHQRLSSSGYVFSASLPPYLASAAIASIGVIEENPQLITKLRDNSKLLSTGLLGIKGLELANDIMSPLVFLRLKKSTGSLKSDLQLLEDLADRVLKEHSVFVTTSKRSFVDKCNLPVGIRIYVSAAHTESDLQKACESLKSVAASLFTD
ncbi:hypothetical protein M8C21_015605 [Ambrosia artemisiifolia]|uniref:serine C-palmitoyltransferase n=1 Tax=Ambrosia artemisiifolia TaxID=4212 RepID=A0AAD5D0G2_AMBAR|nr:hypothetical protein M8C21_015605 [Ambrosia artemisiifolia]